MLAHRKTSLGKKRLKQDGFRVGDHVTKNLRFHDPFNLKECAVAVSLLKTIFASVCRVAEIRGRSRKFSIATQSAYQRNLY